MIFIPSYKEIGNPKLNFKSGVQINFDTYYYNHKIASKSPPRINKLIISVNT